MAACFDCGAALLAVGGARGSASYVFDRFSWGCSSRVRRLRLPLRLPQRGRFWSWPKPLVVALAAPADASGLESSRDVLLGVVREVMLNKKKLIKGY